MIKFFFLRDLGSGHKPSNKMAVTKDISETTRPAGDLDNLLFAQFNGVVQRINSTTQRSGGDHA